MVHVAFVCL
ncbi:hypothetical protein U0070_001993 [Myodes glareolus]|uniref:Uncharacterized protein n=1 Tax=Myodes glareolus TaxID=447135 RepID=A0AAW0J766_MYOGA